MMEYILYIVFTVLFIWLILNIYMYLFGYKHAFNFYHSNDIPSNFGIDMNYKFLTSSSYDADVLLWYKKPKAGKPTIVYFHGRSDSLGWRSSRYNEYIKKGYGVVASSYFYNGSKNKKPVEKIIISDGHHILNWVVSELRIKKKDIVLYGESFGCAVASKIASSNDKCRGLVMEVPFYNMYRMFVIGAKKIIGFFYYIFPVIKIFVGYEFDNAKNLKKVNIPVLIGGAQKDAVTPFNHSVELYEVANTPKKHITFKDRRHMELYDTKDWVNEVCDFAEKGLGKIKKQKKII